MEKENGQPTATYTYGDDLLSQSRSGGSQYFVYDALGSTRALTDSTGRLTDSYEYSAYGELTGKTGSSTNSYLYTGERFDENLNQYYLRARYYSPGNGRFSQRDSYAGRNGEPITLHKYLYAGSSPANYIDPSGKFSELIVSTSFNSSYRAESFLVAQQAAIWITGYISLVVLYEDIKLSLAASENEAAIYSSDTSEGQRQKEYEIAKQYCDTPPEPGRNDCASLSKQIDHAEQCINLYSEWDTRWLKGRHSEKIWTWQNRVDNLKKEHKKKCTGNM